MPDESVIHRHECFLVRFPQPRRVQEIGCGEDSGRRCDEILTEDLNDGQMYGSVKAVNPFKNF